MSTHGDHQQASSQSQSNGGQSVPELSNSSRSFLKATYSRVDTPRDEPTAVDKLAFARSLAVSGPESEILMARAGAGDDGVLRALTLARAASAGPGAALAAAGLAGQVRADDLVELATRSVTLRTEQRSTSPALAEQLRILTDRFQERRTVEPVAWLHLERVETTPVGVERGELVGTVPMAPGEKVFVSHKEWATRSSEFQDIVVDELESYSERGVAEKSDVAMGNESETKRDSSLNFGVSASGGYGPVSMTTTLTVSSSDSERESRSHSTKHAVEQTRKSSSRVRKEHKVSLRVETRSGTEDIAAKEIVNSTGKAVRIDYYRMMRKWRVDLIRYGLRMTYDLVIPEPGAGLRQEYTRLQQLRSQLGPFVFAVQRGAITPNTYLDLADQFDAQVPPVPSAPGEPVIISASVPGLQGESGAITHFPLSFDLGPGYRVKRITLDGVISSPEEVPIGLSILGCSFRYDGGNVTLPPTILVRRGAGGNFLEGATGRQSVLFVFQGADAAAVQLIVETEPTPAAMEQWRTDVWNALFTAGQARHYADQQGIAAQIAELQDTLNRDDTLSLRRGEREEVMKRTLQWLFGPGFDTSPDEVKAAVERSRTDPSTLPIDDTQWLTVREFGEFVKFLHHAIEWENVLYFLYPYFWGSDELATTRHLLWHPDPARREFLRAGAARVVLPVRSGFEIEFAQFMEDGVLGDPGGQTPYLSIAQEMQAFARTNYAGIPPANPDVAARSRPVLSLQQQQAWEDIGRLVRAVEAYATAAKQREHPEWTGVPAEPRYYPSTAQGLRVLPAPPQGPLPLRDPWGNDYRYSAPGRTAPFVIWSHGADGRTGGTGDGADISTDADGNLIATWYEYTPSSGIDIEVGTPSTALA